MSSSRRARSAPSSNVVSRLLGLLLFFLGQIPLQLSPRCISMFISLALYMCISRRRSTVVCECLYNISHG